MELVLLLFKSSVIIFTCTTVRKNSVRQPLQRLVGCFAIIGEENIPAERTLYVFVDAEIRLIKHATLQAIAPGGHQSQSSCESATAILVAEKQQAVTLSLDKNESM